MEATKEVKVIKVEEGEAGKARKLVSSILADLVDGAEGEGRGGGKIKGKKEDKTKAKSKVVEEVKGEIEMVCVNRASGYVTEVGKFKERKFDFVGRGRGKGVCEYCGGTCCSAMRDLIKYFTGLELIPTTTKVGLIYSGGIYLLLLI